MAVVDKSLPGIDKHLDIGISPAAVRSTHHKPLAVVAEGFLLVHNILVVSVHFCGKIKGEQATLVTAEHVQQLLAKDGYVAVITKPMSERRAVAAVADKLCVCSSMHVL